MSHILSLGVRTKLMFYRTYSSLLIVLSFLIHIYYLHRLVLNLYFFYIRIKLISPKCYTLRSIPLPRSAGAIQCYTP